MKKIIIIVLTLLMLTSCKDLNEKNNTEINKDNNLSTQYFKLEEINLDCNLNNITFIIEKYIISNNVLYEYSTDKKNQVIPNVK